MGLDLRESTVFISTKVSCDIVHMSQ